VLTQRIEYQEVVEQEVVDGRIVEKRRTVAKPVTETSAIEERQTPPGASQHAVQISRDATLSRAALFQQRRMGTHDVALSIVKAIEDDAVRADTLISMTEYYPQFATGGDINETFFLPLLREIRQIKSSENQFRALKSFVNTVAAAAQSSDTANRLDSGVAAKDINEIRENDVPKLDSALLKSDLLFDVAGTLYTLSDDHADKAFEDARKTAESAPSELPKNRTAWLHSLPLGLGLLFFLMGLVWEPVSHGFCVALGEATIHAMLKRSRELQTLVRRALASVPPAPPVVAEFVPTVDHLEEQVIANSAN
jgi:hypothetical protein